MAITRVRHFEIIRTVFAMAEERQGVSLADAADAVGLPVAEVRALLEPVLFLEYRDDQGEFIDETRAFLLDEGDVLRVDEGHWLRNLAARPPTPCGALRLYAAGKTVADSLPSPAAALRSAVAKLEDLLEGSVVIPTDHPPCLDVCVRASRSRRRIAFTYTTDSGTTGPRTVEPHHVYTNWGKWYVQGPEIGDAVLKSWRVDRMVDAVAFETSFPPPEPLDLPDRFDLSEYELTVELRLPETMLDNLPTPNNVAAVTDDQGGFVRAVISVNGEHRMRHLLVAAGPEATVVGPSDSDRAKFDALRRQHAAQLLRSYLE